MNNQDDLKSILHDLMNGQKPTLTNTLNLTNEQTEIVFKKHIENIIIAEKIRKLNLSSRWTTTITSICVTRAFKGLNKQQIKEIETITTTNSEAVFYLANEGKKVGLELLEKISLVSTEIERSKAVNLLLKNGVKNSKKDLEIIFNHAISEKNLLDYM